VLGLCFYSGAVEAWRGEMVSGAAMLVGSVGGGLLGHLDSGLVYL
jgi:hypothetical protein